MRGYRCLTKHLLSCCAAALLVTVPAAANSDDDASQARSLMHAGTILPLTHFIHRAQQIHPGRVIEAELEHEAHHGGYVYEIIILDAQGEIWELEFHAETGDLVEKELKGHR